MTMRWRVACERDAGAGCLCRQDRKIAAARRIRLPSLLVDASTLPGRDDTAPLSPHRKRIATRPPDQVASQHPRQGFAYPKMCNTHQPPHRRRISRKHMNPMFSRHFQGHLHAKENMRRIVIADTASPRTQIINAPFPCLREYEKGPGSHRGLLVARTCLDVIRTCQNVTLQLLM